MGGGVVVESQTVVGHISHFHHYHILKQRRGNPRRRLGEPVNKQHLMKGIMAWIWYRILWVNIFLALSKRLEMVYGREGGGGLSRSGRWQKGVPNNAWIPRQPARSDVTGHTFPSSGTGSFVDGSELERGGGKWNGPYSTQTSLEVNQLHGIISPRLPGGTCLLSLAGTVGK